MPTCNCRRCEELTDCLSVVFVMQHGFDEDTTMNLCGGCYDMYRQLYVTHIDDDDEADTDLDEDPCNPVDHTAETDIDNPL